MVKAILTILIIVSSVFCTILVQPAMAADLGVGPQIFNANCAACHANGLNAVNPTKTLRKSDLDKYAMASLEAIQTQVMNGKNAMPAFRGRLKPNEIESVAAYVLD
ncbi:MAG: c-type cytochrome, partial [Cyanobacteria bacterium P01_H01_bin.152]